MADISISLVTVSFSAGVVDCHTRVKPTSPPISSGPRIDRRKIVFINRWQAISLVSYSDACAKLHGIPSTHSLVSMQPKTNFMASMGSVSSRSSGSLGVRVIVSQSKTQKKIPSGRRKIKSDDTHGNISLTPRPTYQLGNTNLWDRTSMVEMLLFTDCKNDVIFTSLKPHFKGFWRGCV